ncbi:hypothetical protein D3C73_1580850 [compost metagenome]
MLRGDRFLVGEALRELARQLALFRRLVDMRRHQMFRLDADLVQQRQAPRRGGREDELGTAGHSVPCLKR